MLATRTDVLWIGVCVFLLGVLFYGGGALWDRWRRKQRRDALMKRIDAFCQQPTLVSEKRTAWALKDGDGIRPIQRGRTR